MLTLYSIIVSQNVKIVAFWLALEMLKVHWKVLGHVQQHWAVYGKPQETFRSRLDIFRNTSHDKALISSIWCRKSWQVYKIWNEAVLRITHARNSTVQVCVLGCSFTIEEIGEFLVYDAEFFN